MTTLFDSYSFLFLPVVIMIAGAGLVRFGKELSKVE